MIYFIHAPLAKKIKIGFTSKESPIDRLKELQTGSPERLLILGFVKGDKKLEKELHQTYRLHYSHGEWFNESCLNQVIGYIKLNFDFMLSLPYELIADLCYHESVFDFRAYYRSETKRNYDLLHSCTDSK